MMNDAKSSKKGCFRSSCCCCSVIILLLVLCGLLLSAGATMFSHMDPDPVDRVAEYVIPSSERAPDPARDATLTPAEAFGQDGTPLPAEALNFSDDGQVELGVASALNFAAGRVELRTDFGSLRVLPAPAGSTIRTELSYDAGRMTVEDELVEEKDGSWTYRLTSDRPAGIASIIGANLEDERITIFIPAGVPFVLDARIGAGESRLELGGLDLLALNVKTGAGSHRITFADPTKNPLESFEVEGSFGEMKILDLGNASPERTKISFSGGELRVGALGDWRIDGTIDVGCQFGECQISLPDDINVEIVDTDTSFGERRVRADRTVDPEAPTLKVKASMTGGELTIR